MNQQELILITGATGFIGNHLARDLVARGCRLRLFVRSRELLTSSLQDHCEIVLGDLGDPDAVQRAVSGVSVIFHCAANVSTWDSEENYFAANVHGTACLLAAVIRQGVSLSRFVHVSSMDVYGFPEQPCDESVKLNSRFGYGRSKVEGEAIVRSMCEEAQIPFVILRPGNVIGPGSQFIDRIGTALQTGVMALIDGGKIHAGLLSIDNLLEVMHWSATAPAAINECFNVRNPEAMSWRTFTDQFREAIRGRGVIISMPYRLAILSGQLIGSVSGRLMPSQEPLWHLLLVNIFGRTCGHQIAKLQSAKGSVGDVTLEQCLKQSFDWYLTRHEETVSISGESN